MKLNKIVLVSLFLIAIFMLGAVSANDDVQSDKLTVEESSAELAVDVEEDSIEQSSNSDDLVGENSEDILSGEDDLGMDINLNDVVEKNKSVEFTISCSNNEHGNLDKVSGNLSFFVDGKYIKSKVLKDYDFAAYVFDFKFNTKSVDYGKHYWEVRYAGDANYKPCSIFGNFTVVPYDISVYNFYHGDYTTVEIMFPEEATGEVSIVVNGKKYTAPIFRQKAIVNITNLNMGDYIVHVDYAGNEKYVQNSFDTVMEVFEREYWEGTNFDERLTFTFFTYKNATGYLHFILDDNEEFNITIVNGVAKYTFDPLTIGRHTFEENSYVNGKYEYWGGQVIDITPKVTLPTEILLNREYALYFELPQNYSGNLTLSYLDDGIYTPIESKVVDGKGMIKFKLTSSGATSLQLDFTSESYNFYESYIAHVSEDSLNVNVVSNPGSDPKFNVKLSNGAQGTVTIVIGDKEYSLGHVKDSKSISISGLANGKYTATVTYSGDENHAAVSKVITFSKTSQSTVKKVDKIKLTLKSVKVKKSAKKLVLSATLKINGKIAKGKKITFKFNKKTYTAKTNKKGVAKVTIKKSVLKKLKVGKKIKYQASYGKTTLKKTVKVKK